MAYREAAAMPAATDRQHNPFSLVDELMHVLASIGSIEAKHKRAMEVVQRRRDEATLTLVLSHPHDYIVNVLNDALLGLRFDRDLEMPVASAVPVKPLILLQSLRKHCKQCKANDCGRQGKYHDIVYKTGTKSGTGAEHRLIAEMGGTPEDNVLCEVDPDTGHFSLPPLEAKKCLRQWGEHIVRPRFKDRAAKRGDRWLVREVAHHEQYIVNRPAALRNDVALTEVEME